MWLCCGLVDYPQARLLQASNEYDLVDNSLGGLWGRIVGYFGKEDGLAYDVGFGESVVLLLSGSLLTTSAVESVYIYPNLERSFLHGFIAYGSGVFPQDVQGFAVGYVPTRLMPYLFAFGSRDGSVIIWSVQSDQALNSCKSAKLFELRDQRSWISKPVAVIGRFLSFPAPTIPTATGSSSEGTNDPSE